MIHPALRNQLGQPTGIKANPVYTSGYTPPNPGNQYGTPYPVQNALPGIGMGLRTGANTVGGAGVQAGGVTRQSASPDLLGLGQLPPELSWMSNPSLQALVKKLVDSGQGADAAALQAQAQATTERAQKEAQMIQGFYQAGANLASRLSPYYQDVLEKSANTLTGLSGAYGQSIDQLAPGQGAVFNELTGAEPASGFQLQRTAVPYGPGARGDLYSVYGPTTSDIGAQTAAMRLAQGETDRKAIEQRITDLKSQAPGQYLQTLTGLGSLVNQGKQLGLQAGIATGAVGGKKTLDAIKIAQDYALGKAGLMGTLGGKPTLQEKQLTEYMRQFNKDWSLKKDAQGLAEDQFKFTKFVDTANLTGQLPDGTRTWAAQEALKLDAYRDATLAEQKAGRLDDKQVADRNLQLQNTAMWLRHGLDLMAENRMGEAQTWLEKYQQGLLDYQGRSLAFDQSKWADTTSQWQQVFNLNRSHWQQEFGLNERRMSVMEGQAERAGNKDELTAAMVEASSHNQYGYGHDQWSIRRTKDGSWEAYNTHKKIIPAGAWSGKKAGMTIDGYPLPKYTEVKSIKDSISKDVSFNVKSIDPNTGRTTYKQRDVPDYESYLYDLKASHLNVSPIQLTEWLNSAKDTLTGKRIYLRGGGSQIPDQQNPGQFVQTGRPLASDEEKALMAKDPGGAFAKGIMRQIAQDTKARWVVDPSTNQSWQIGQPGAAQGIANGLGVANHPLKSAVQGGGFGNYTPHDVGSPPKDWTPVDSRGGATWEGTVARVRGKDGVMREVYRDKRGNIRLWPPPIGRTVVPGSSYGGTNTYGSAYAQ